MKYPLADPEGTSTYKRYRDGSEIIGETGMTYVLQSGDTDTTIRFEVTPTSLSGVSGSPVQSNSIYIPIPPVPEATSVTIL